ncbi:MAG: hypothetical protein HY427_03320 [Candidatus Levybacteria bacterium]|nr:hypothetical protein [Candidatus Levybacteria bacterium]
MIEGNKARGTVRTEKQIASELRDHPNMERVMFEQVLEPYLTRLESLGATAIDVQRVYLKLATAFLFSSSTQRALQTRRLEELYVDHKLSLKSNHEKQNDNGIGITLEAGIEHLI